MNRYKRNNGALVGALGVVAALTITAALGAMFATRNIGALGPTVSGSCKESLSERSAALPIEPELMRTDRATEHHG